MGDVRFAREYEAVSHAGDPVAAMKALSDEGVVAALAAASRARDPYLANVLATEAMNRTRRWSAALRSLEDGLLVLDRDGRVLVCNPAADSLLGWEPGGLAGKVAADVLRVDDESPRFLLALQTGEAVRLDDARFSCKAGEPLPVAYSASPIEHEGELEGAVLVFRDITRRKRAEEQRLARERQRRLHDRVLVQLAKNAALVENDLERAFSELTECASRTLEVTRVGVWLFDHDRTHVGCVHQYDARSGNHSPGPSLDLTKFPSYAEALSSERLIATDDARTDPRTSEFTESYLKPLGITSMLDVPLRIGGRMRGILCLEHVGPQRAWRGDERAFASALADLAAVSLAASDERAARGALHAAQATLTNVLRSVNAVLFALDAEGRFLLVEGRLTERVLDMGSLVGRSAFELFGQRPEAAATLRRALSGEEFVSYEEEAGRTYQVRWSPMEQGGVVAIALDVTKEEAYRRALSASETRYARLVDSVEGIVWEGNPRSMSFTFVSPFAEKVLGFPVERITREPGFWLDRVHPADRAIVRRFYENLGGENEPHALEYRVLDAEGRVVWLRDVVRMLDEADGEPHGIGVMVDTTDRRQAEQELARHRDRLRELVDARTRELSSANQELEAFSHSVSHDLRAHLRGIHALAEALHADYGEQVDAEGRRLLDSMLRETRGMGEMLEDLRSLSRATGGELRMEPLDLAAMSKEIVGAMRTRDPGRRVALRTDAKIPAWGDAGLLRIALENLLDNAWKYTSRRGEALIEVGMIDTGDAPVYFVRDNGAGFDMALAARLFRPFQRLHASPDFPGTGIGLATVRRVISRHGGRVWAESHPGMGATFYFTLPRRNPEPAAE